MTGRNAESPPKTTSVNRIINPAPEETPRMNGLASSFLVIAWKIAPDTARFIPTSIPTNTRGSRMFQTIRLSRLISGNSPPNRNAFHTCPFNRTFGSKTALHACVKVIEYAPKLTCTSPATVMTTRLPIAVVRSFGSNSQPNRRSVRVLPVWSVPTF